VESISFFAEFIVGKIVEKLHVARPKNWKATVKIKLVWPVVSLKAIFL